MINLQDVSLLNILAPNLTKDTYVIAAAKAFDEVLREIIQKIPNVSIIPRIREITEELLLDLLAWQFHVDFYDPDIPLTLEIKRELVIKSLDWHTRKATPSVVEEIVNTVFADAQIAEWYGYGGRPYRFRANIEITTTNIGERQMWRLINAIYSVKNTRSHLDEIILKQTIEKTEYTACAESIYIYEYYIEETEINTDKTEFNAVVAAEYTSGYYIEETEIATEKIDYIVGAATEYTSEYYIEENPIAETAVNYISSAASEYIQEVHTE